MIGHDYQTFEHATKVLWFTVVFLRYNPDIMRYIIPDYEALDSKHKTEVLEQCGVWGPAARYRESACFSGNPQ